MSAGKRSINSSEVFDGLVENAIDFLRHSVQELRKSPKYSMIDFCSAIEVFFKARLLLEHWTLIIDKPENAKPDKFRAGDANTVTVEMAIKRLCSIADAKIKEEESDCFNKIRQHRNRLVHFFDPKYVGEPNEDVLCELVAEQCKGWYYLHRLLTNDWRAEFNGYLDKIEDLDQLMHQQRQFLQTKYQMILPEIENLKKEGIVVHKCPVCGYEALREDVVLDPLVTLLCLVCQDRSSALKVPCPNCEDSVYVYDLGKGTCASCGGQTSIEYLVKLYHSWQSPWQNPDDEMVERSNAYCAECGYGIETVIRWGDRWCLSCQTEYERVDNCGWCGELVTGDLSDSALTGCGLCYGRLGDLDDD